MTDRIKQMAEEAGLLPCHEVYAEDLAKFAALVAEDVLSDEDGIAELMAEHLYGHPRSDAIEWAKEDKFDSQKDKALELIAIMKSAIRARYPKPD